MASSGIIRFGAVMFGHCWTSKVPIGSSFCLPVRHGHWFTKFYSRKQLTRPVSNEVLEKYKEQAGVVLPDTKAAPALLRKYLDSSVPESVKRIHSLEFKDFEVAINDVVKDKLIRLGLNPVEESTAHEIVRLTVRIRVQREQMGRGRNCAAIERGLLGMIERRDALLRLLRSEDYARFLALSRDLALAFEHAPPPWCAEPPKTGFARRLAETRERCQALKARRLSELRSRTEAAKSEFVARRDAALADAREKLASLGLSLERTLDEVYADRRAEAEADLLEDKLRWYYGEQRQHLKYVARLAEKAKAAQSRARK